MGRPIRVSELSGPMAAAVRRARQGERVAITSRGEPVALVVPVDDDDLIRWGPGKPLPRRDPVPIKGGLQDLIQEGRR